MNIGSPFGRTVWVLQPTTTWNGVNIAPAVVNRVWSEDCVNVTAFPDCVAPVSFTSLKLYPTLDAALAAVQEALKHGHLSHRVACWPPGVLVPPYEVNEVKV